MLFKVMTQWFFFWLMTGHLSCMLSSVRRVISLWAKLFNKRWNTHREDVCCAGSSPLSSWLQRCTAVKTECFPGSFSQSAVPEQDWTLTQLISLSVSDTYSCPSTSFNLVCPSDLDYRECSFLSDSYCQIYSRSQHKCLFYHIICFNTKQITCSIP